MQTGFPIAVQGQKIGLLGGSFDPAHEGHLRLSAHALRRFGLDRVWWLVTPGNPLKSRSPAPMDTRLEDARDMIDDPRIVVTGIESALQTRLTVDTLRALQRHYPRVRFVWLMGSDNLVQFPRWTGWREIAERMPIGVLARPETRLSARMSKAARILGPYRLPISRAQLLAETPPPAWVMLDMPLTDRSSTDIRNARRRGAISP